MYYVFFFVVVVLFRWLHSVYNKLHSL